MSIGSLFTGTAQCLHVLSIIYVFILVVERDERQRETKIYIHKDGGQQRVLIVGTSIRRTQIELAQKNDTVYFVFNIYLLIPLLY